MARLRPFLVPAIAGALVIALLLVFESPCQPISRSAAVQGSHGYRVWTGADIQSFEHADGRTCIPAGWEAVGALRSGSGWATFAPGKTGVLIRSDAFLSKELSFSESSYRVTLRYPTTTPAVYLDAYEALVRRAFTRVGALYPKTKVSSHTVLVTAGISFSDSEKSSIYPDPGSDVSYLILSPKQSRFEELFMHAVMHLYNRHGGADTEYEKKQSRMSAEDFQELEASWSESALIESDTERHARVEYLYSVHTAVRTRDFSRLHEPPFDNFVLDAGIDGRMMVSHGTYLDYQYAHYVLAPLIMDGIEGLLQKYAPEKSVAGLLTNAHRENADFFALVEESLPETEFARVTRWLQGTETIDRNLIDLGLAFYDRHYP